MARWLLLAFLAAPPPLQDELAPIREHVASRRDGTVPWTIDFSRLEGDRSSLPIGVFDSGIGGLTVLEAILKLDAFDNRTLQPGADGVPDFAGERFVYFGDQANMPYGNYPARGAEPYLRELIVKDAIFLLGVRWRESAGAAPRFDKPPVKAIVVACNTATAYGLDDLRGALQAWKLDVPVIGIIEAGARAVAELLPAGGGAGSVGVLATVGTCSSNAYPKAIARAAGLAGKPAPTLVQQGSIGLAGAIDGNPAFVWTGTGRRPVPYEGPAPALKDAAPPNSVPEYARYDVGRLLLDHRGPLRQAPMSLLVLGCTHFPLAQKEISEALARMGTVEGLDGCVAAELRLVDPAEHAAKELFRELARSRLRVKEAGQPRTEPSARFYVSVPNPGAPGIRLAEDGSLDAATKTARKPGQPDREDTVPVPLTPGSLPESTRRLVQSLPATWKQLQAQRRP